MLERLNLLLRIKAVNSKSNIEIVLIMVYSRSVIVSIFLLLISNFVTSQQVTENYLQFYLNKVNEDSINYKFSISEIIRLTDRIKHRDSIILNTKKTTEKLEYLYRNYFDKDTIIEILEYSLFETEKSINDNLLNLRIAKFFCIQDTSIFRSGFESFEFSEIPLCLHNHYKLISNIRKLDNLIIGINTKISKIETEQYLKNLQINVKQEILKSVISENIEEANLLIKDIEAQDKSNFYPNQYQFYRPYLIALFNGCIEKISSND